MSRLGAHLSTAGTVVKALDRAAVIGAESLQIFTRAPSQWRAREFKPDEARRFCERRAELSQPGRPFPVLAHDIYLTNLACPEGDVRRRTVATLAEERRRCAELGVDALVCHMGAHTGCGVDEGLERFAEGIEEVLSLTPSNPVRILLENSAGQGTCLGHKFEHIARVLDRVGRPDSLGCCIDTCHALAAGYDLVTARGYKACWREFEQTVGLERLFAFHLNDSKKPLGCRVDRHEHIGRGALGEKTFARLLADARFEGLPMVTETPLDDDMDLFNLDLLRRLRAGSAAPPRNARGRRAKTP